MRTNHEPQLRRLTRVDIGPALELSVEAGWNQTLHDWRLLIELAPEGCLAIEVEGEVAATATLITYGQKLAWIGMVLTRVKHRGRGFAKRLMSEALRLAGQMGIASVKLDATDQGQPLYENLGFRAEQTVERWGCDCLSMANEFPRLASGELSQALLTFDESVFGANRARLLQKLAEINMPAVLDRAYALTRPGRVARYLGPILADSEQKARSVITSALSEYSGQSCYWDLFPANQNAVRLAREFGLAPKRRLTRMVRGSNLRHNDLCSNDQLIYALGGFELG